MAKVLIFDTDTTGHHIEYLNHLYRGALQHHENSYVFAVGDDISEKSKEFSWEPNDNVEFLKLKEMTVEDWLRLCLNLALSGLISLSSLYILMNKAERDYVLSFVKRFFVK